MTIRELKDLIFECYVDLLRKQESQKSNILKEETNNIFSGNPGAVLPDATDQMLAKFPTLKHVLIRLHSEDFNQFVRGVDWISPRPTVFRINLVNGQQYTLKWLGKDFEIEIMGKTYYLGTTVEFRRALEKMTALYQEGPMGSGDAEGSGAEDSGSSSGVGGGSGIFPGAGDSPGPEFEAGGEPGGEEEKPEEKKDMSDETVDFEADSDI